LERKKKEKVNQLRSKKAKEVKEVEKSDSQNWYSSIFFSLSIRRDKDKFKFLTKF
jgi:hypothetical protein